MLKHAKDISAILLKAFICFALLRRYISHGERGLEATWRRVEGNASAAFFRRSCVCARVRRSVASLMIRHVCPLHLALGCACLLSVNNEREGGRCHKITHVLMAGEDGALCIQGKTRFTGPGGNQGLTSVFFVFELMGKLDMPCWKTHSCMQTRDTQ